MGNLQASERIFLKTAVEITGDGLAGLSVRHTFISLPWKKKNLFYMISESCYKRTLPKTVNPGGEDVSFVIT